MRIAYLVHGAYGAGSGVRDKILSQAATWSLLGAVVGVFVRCEAGDESDWVDQPHVVRVRASRHGILGRLVQRELLSLDVARWRPDAVYLRQTTVSPSIVALAFAVPTVVEVNTLDLAELRIRSRPRYWWAVATRRLVLRAARAIVAVADEIARHPDLHGLGKAVATIPNSIDLAAYVPLPSPDNTEPRLVFLGAPGLPWHGVDKIARMAVRFPGWRFDVVGPDPAELPGAPPNLFVHGVMTREEYLPILAAADVGIGSLALHRKSMDEATPLKVAEYLAHGLPAVIGYRDGRFPDGAPFLLRLPNVEHNVDPCVEAIASFVREWRGRRVERAAIEGIDARHVERRRLELIASVAGRGGAGHVQSRTRVG